MNNATLLIEIGVEELPPKAMRSLADAFADGVAEGLRAAGLAFSGYQRLASPRRLAVVLADTADCTESVAVEKSGPTVAIAFKADGTPTPAAEGFARSLGTTVDQLEREDSDKGERLVYRGVEDGKPLAALLQTVVDKALKRLPVPKLMRWGDTDAAFVRPVHWVVALHGTDTVALTVFGVESGSATFGHRFHHPRAIELDNADDYARALASPGHVMVDPDERQARVRTEVEQAASRFGGTALIDEALLEEVNALVEWPAGVAGHFDTRFLALPREVLVATLQGHQRYFPVLDTNGDLMAGFVTVANIESRDVAQVIAGNERVVGPRLSDALFFWEADRRHGLTAHVESLARVSFQNKLGSLADKSQRVASIAETIATATDIEPSDLARAATLSKTDLLTEMVGEFPELQGVMGRYYALDAGETARVADALESQYAPIRSGAPIAPDAIGRTLALADRMDTLAGIFSIGQRPSGDKDPFALRRAALSVLRTLVEASIALDLRQALEFAISVQPVEAASDTADALWMFHMERLRGYYADQGIAGDRFDSIENLGVSNMVDFDRRLRAVDRFAAQDDARTVCDAHKRIRNILRRNTDDGDTTVFDTALLQDPAEKQLAAALAENRDIVARASDAGQYDDALSALTQFAAPLNTFFNDVMVMADDESLRHNRLALLGELDQICRRVADISCISLNDHN